jgi:hypothetical protein
MVEEDFQAWERLCELIWGCAIGQAIHVAVELGIPELLSAGPRSAEQLAVATGADPWTLETILRALAAFEVLSFADQQLYGLTRMGSLLLKSAPGPSAGEAGAFFETLYRPLGDLLAMTRTGDVAFDRVYGTSFYDHLAENPGLADHFYHTMAANASQRYAGLSAICNISGVSRIIDVGGGDGSLLLQILDEHREIKGVVFDLPMVSDRAIARINALGMSDRCAFVAGDFRKSVPEGGDLYVLAQILNNWRDAEVLSILANCRGAMKAGARLLVLEPIYVPGRPSRWRTLVSLGVLAQRGGRTRSEAQLRSLFAAARFCIETIRQLPSNATFAIEARPVA